MKATEMTLEERVAIMEDERGVMLNLIDQQEDALKAVKLHLEGSNTDSPEHRAFILGLVNGVLGKGGRMEYTLTVNGRQGAILFFAIKSFLEQLDGEPDFSNDDIFHTVLEDVIRQIGIGDPSVIETNDEWVKERKEGQ